MQWKTGTQANSLKNANGFSLIEIMLFLGMLVAVLYGSSAIVFQSSRQTSEDRHRWEASELGAMVMEELTFSFMTAGQLNPNGNQELRYYDQDYAQVAAADSFYTVNWSIQQNSPMQGIYHIQLAVRWNEGNNAKAVTFETYR